MYLTGVCIPAGKCPTSHLAEKGAILDTGMSVFLFFFFNNPIVLPRHPSVEQTVRNAVEDCTHTRTVYTHIYCKLGTHTHNTRSEQDACWQLLCLIAAWMREGSAARNTGQYKTITFCLFLKESQIWLKQHNEMNHLLPQTHRAIIWQSHVSFFCLFLKKLLTHREKKSPFCWLQRRNNNMQRMRFGLIKRVPVIHVTTMARASFIDLKSSSEDPLGN